MHADGLPHQARARERIADLETRLKAATEASDKGAKPGEEIAESSQDAPKAEAEAEVAKQQLQQLQRQLAAAEAMAMEASSRAAAAEAAVAKTIAAADASVRSAVVAGNNPMQPDEANRCD